LPPPLKPGGAIAIWVYDGYNPLYKVSDFYRRVTTRLPPNTLYAMCKVAARTYPLYRLPLVGALFRAGLPVSAHPNPDRRVLDTFDWYSPKYQWKHTYADLYTWFEHEGLQGFRALDNPVAASARKPDRSTCSPVHDLTRPA
jgi:hypothetical protein